MEIWVFFSEKCLEADGLVQVFSSILYRILFRVKVPIFELLSFKLHTKKNIPNQNNRPDRNFIASPNIPQMVLKSPTQKTSKGRNNRHHRRRFFFHPISKPNWIGLPCWFDLFRQKVPPTGSRWSQSTTSIKDVPELASSCPVRHWPHFLV